MAYKFSTIVKNNYKFITIILAPLLVSILPIVIQTKEAYCAFVVIIMAIYWVTEALPLGITSLLPVVLFPTFGISPAEKVTVGYFKDIVMLFFGGLVVANSIEVCRLHERIALKVLMLFGSNPKWLLLGFMLVTAFLSLWISNTASTAMMLPIIDAVVTELIKSDPKYQDNPSEIEEKTINMEIFKDDINSVPNEENNKKINENTKAKRMRTGFLLAAAYSASIGGLGSLVGTAPNVLVKGYFDKNYPEYRLNFFSFMLFALPVSIIMLFFAWIWITVRWLPLSFSFKKKISNESSERVVSLKPLLQQKYAELGDTTWAQYCTGIIFVILVTLWVTKDLHFTSGWGSLFIEDYVTDSIPAIFAVFLLFMCPRENIFRGRKYEHLVDWKALQKIFPWDIVLLLGGSLVMADGFKESGLSVWIASQFKTFSNQPKEVLLIILILIIASLTEFTSNTSIASIFLPIIDEIATQSNINPIYLLLPMILSVSLAFALPIATPPNAVIFSYGNLKMRDMITTGVLMNFLGICVILLAANTWLVGVFDYVPSNNNQLMSTLSL